MEGREQMIWQEIFINKRLNKQEIEQMMVEVFNISTKEVFVTSSIEKITDEIQDNIKILCEVGTVNAEFEMKLGIYLREEYLVPKDDVETIMQICKITGSKALTTIDSEIPNEMLIISNDETAKTFVDLGIYEDVTDCDLN
jgi:uncharacterized Rossmann fold enzyme